jgi:hypothetical protein
MTGLLITGTGDVFTPLEGMGLTDEELDASRAEAVTWGGRHGCSRSDPGQRRRPRDRAARYVLRISAGALPGGGADGASDTGADVRMSNGALIPNDWITRALVGATALPAHTLTGSTVLVTGGGGSLTQAMWEARAPDGPARRAQPR